MIEPSASARIFVSVSPVAEVREKLRRVQEQLRRKSRDAVRWTPPEQMHLTLRFFGDVPVNSLGDIEAGLRRSCAGRGAFELRAAGLGGFPNMRQPRVLWVGLGGDVKALSLLQEAISRETAAWGQQEAREFSPHLTIGRVREGRGMPELTEELDRLAAAEFGAWRAGEVRLMQSKLSSEGAQHEELAVIRLAEAG